MDDYLSIRIRNKLYSFFGKPLAQVHIVFNDPIVHDCEVSRAVCMRMRIDPARLAMRRPARMSNTERMLGHLSVYQLFKLRKFSFFFIYRQFPLIQICNSRAVITTVFQLLQPAN